MKLQELKQQDVKLLLKASIDYNSAMLALVAQVTDNYVKPYKVVRAITSINKQHERQLKEILGKYGYNPASD